MKTIKNNKTGELKRITDSETKPMSWSYVPKQAWKEFSRPKKEDSPKKENKKEKK